MLSKMFTKTTRLLLPSFSSIVMPTLPGISLRKDVYNSLHIALPENVHKQEKDVQKYINDLTKMEENNNKMKGSQEETNAIWVHLKGDNLCYAAFLFKNGYKIHSGLDSSLVLFKWISRQSDLVPPFSNFHISCGSVIIHQNKILLVQEKKGPRQGQYGIPGGRADVGEYISKCSQRQLFEETGIKAKFGSIVYFRQIPMAANKQVDLYYVCLMNFQQKDILDLKICQRELSDYKWVALDQYRKFSQQNCWGTQRSVASYLSDLYDSGFDLKKDAGKYPKTIESKYIHPTNPERCFPVVQHRLI